MGRFSGRPRLAHPAPGVLRFKIGEVTVVLGRNGVGKTTLLKSLMGVVPIKTGSIVLEGRDISRDTPYERVRHGMAYVRQGREIFALLTVERGEIVQRGLGKDMDGEGARERMSI